MKEKLDYKEYRKAFEKAFRRNGGKEDGSM